jgi:hypothetical protein
MSLLDEKVIQSLAKQYHPLLYFTKLISLLQSLFPTEDFQDCSKHDLHLFVNETVLENYGGECLLKYKLSERYFHKRNIVAAYEMRVNNSRADFITINGNTTSFEIKSAHDNFTKFPKQSTDYLSVFEFNNLVVDHVHLSKALDLLPEYYGLWTYKNGKYRQIKKAVYNDQINPASQLGLLSKKERLGSFPEYQGNVELILACLRPEEINTRFKLILKARYCSRWNFIVKHRSSILPVDLQFFFNNNVLPLRVYNQSLASA